MPKRPGIVTIACALFVAWVISYVILPPIGKVIYQAGADDVHVAVTDPVTVRDLEIQQ